MDFGSGRYAEPDANSYCYRNNSSVSKSIGNGHRLAHSYSDANTKPDCDSYTTAESDAKTAT